MAKSLFYFIVAGFFEIGGGYLVWLALKEDKGPWYLVAGAVVLFLYGIIPTLQEASFGRVYAAYGGIFIVLSILWGWQVDKVVPDMADLVGGAIALVGVLIIMYYPR
ncbi:MULTISPECIES: YnfA family protein [Veillonella]|uniref:YnfA family protein n=1 Tax=Veillonella TaxID=29465 RepID=UPI001D051671|nr:MULTISPECIES: YnfA family protein [Veillonella]MCK0529743.1 YnfA family protein [Veillonella sp. KGMB01456]MCB5744416.1 YnfA family protein [Veillonella ratti]MCB5758392.1 YnfA family protein [Veillonella ratti]MCB5760694.1 YnfA family protein [Veillonella ratti]MCB5762973.1 YnfA family protein [Veillonella ratti]